MSVQDDRLDSWKEIADYLGKGVTTVRRWEREEGLPVRRLEHAQRGSVVALRSELDAWLRSRTTEARQPPVAASTAPEPQPKRRSRWPVMALVLALACGAIGLGLTVARHPRQFDAEHIVLAAYPGGESHPTFAPGARRFAYAAQWAVWIKDVGIEPPRLVYSEPAKEVCCLRWSPDGRWIAVSYRESGAYRLAILDDKGQVVRRLGHGGPEMHWTRDSRALLYGSVANPGGPFASFERDLASGRVRQVSFPPPGSWGDIAASQSPDGRQLAVARFLSFGKGDVYVSPYGGSEARRVTSTANWVLGVDWMPDGQSVVFGGTAGGKSGIFLAAANGTAGPELVEGAEGSSRYPEAAAIGGGGARIAYGSERWNMDLTRYDPATRQSQLLAPSTRDDEAPDLADNGRLVFTSGRSGASNLWVCEGECQAPRQITFFKETHSELAPHWSPDGGRIAYRAMRSGSPAIVVVGASGQGERVLSSGFDEGIPTWSRDGRFVYFRSSRAGPPEIWRVPAEGGGPGERITQGGGQMAIESGDGTWLYFTRTIEEAVLFRRPLAGGPEEAIPEAGKFRRNEWAVRGSSVYRLEEGSSIRPAQVLRFEASTGRTETVLTAPPQIVIRSFTTNAAGIVVWSGNPPVDDNLEAVDLRPRPFWR